MLASGRPCASEMWPPATKSWPFDSIVWPEQNRFVPTGLAVNVLVAGSHRYGSPNLPHAKTLPVDRRCRCTATMGQGVGALHSPTSDEPATSSDGRPTVGSHA